MGSILSLTQSSVNSVTSAYNLKRLTRTWQQYTLVSQKIDNIVHNAIIYYLSIKYFSLKEIHKDIMVTVKNDAFFPSVWFFKKE